MNVRIKKELQPLFWPWFVCAVIGILPLAVWGITDILFSSPSSSYDLLHWRRNAYFIANSTFVLGVAILVSLPFGSELQQRTLGLLFSQPLPRWQIWREKMQVMLAAVLTLTLAHAAGYLTNPSAFLPNLKFAILFLLVVVCSGVFWSLVSRSVLGGIVLSLFSLAALFLLAYAFTDQYFFIQGTTYQLSSTRSFVMIAALLMAPLFLWLAWRKFSRMEPSVSWENESSAGWSDSLRSGLPWLRSRPGSPIFNFILKELHLLKPIFRMMAAFVLLWAGAALGATMLPSKTVLFTNIINGLSSVYAPLIIILSGCLSLGEEKKLGIHAANLSLPLSPARQWLIKNLLASAAGLIATVILFSIMPHLTGHKLDVLPSKILNESLDLTAVVWMLVICLIQISFATAVIANRMSYAAFLSVIMAGGSAALFFSGWALGHYLNLPVQKPLFYLIAHAQMTCWLAQKWIILGSILLWGISCLSMVYAGWRCFRYLNSETQKFTHVLIIMLGCTLPLAMMHGAVSRQLDRENFMKSSLCQEVKAAFVSLNMDVFPSDKKRESDVAHHDVMATGKISPLTEAWLRDCKFIVIYEPEKAVTGSKPTIRVIVQFTKPGRYETVYLKTRTITQ